MRREERVTVQGPVKEQQPDGMSVTQGVEGVLTGAWPRHRRGRVVCVVCGCWVGMEGVRPLMRSAVVSLYRVLCAGRGGGWRCVVVGGAQVQWRQRGGVLSG